MPRIIDLGVTRYDWVETLTSVSAPSAAQLNAGVNLSPFVVTTTVVGPTSSDTVNERSITDITNVVVPTIGNYEGNLVLFRESGTAPAVFGTNDPFEVFTEKGLLGFVVKRIGLPAADTHASGQVLQVYKFLTDEPQPMGGQGDGYLKLQVPLFQQGVFDTRAVSVA
jgi:hypothetical protein